MKGYPSIVRSDQGPKGERCHVYVKYDGSNLRFEWTKKRGRWKFGTRNRLFDQSDPDFGQAIDCFLSKYADGLTQIFRSEKSLRSVNEVTVFCEWFGRHSICEFQDPSDEKTLVLFDVNPLRQGFVGPKYFTDVFGGLPDAAELLCETTFDDDLISQVRDGTLDCGSKHRIANLVPEGVVCKGGTGHGLWRAKIKTNRYLAELKRLYSDNWKQHWE